MLGRTVYAAIMVLMLISAVAADSSVRDQNPSNVCVDQKLNKEISQNNPDGPVIHPPEIDRNENIVKRITGEMSDSRKMGIGVLLVLIGSVLYAGFNWNENQSAF